MSLTDRVRHVFARVTELQQHGLRPSAPQHYEYIFNRLVVEFKPKNEEDTTLQTHSIELSRKSSYDQVVDLKSINRLFVCKNNLLTLHTIVGRLQAG